MICGIDETINNQKHYKECEIVMLKTTEPSKLLLRSENNIEYDGITSNWGGENLIYLYVLSKEKCYYGDWLINPDGFPEIFGPDWGAQWSKEEIFKCKKIVASYSNLDLPTLPHFFIKKYVEEFNKGNKISTVSIEFYEDGFLQYESNELGIDWSSETDMTGHPITYRKANEDVVKVKFNLHDKTKNDITLLIEMWVESQSFNKYGGTTPQTFDVWIKEIL